jgi:hypothetical protein
MKQYTTKRYKLTSKTALPVQMFWLENTRRKIAVPYSINTGVRGNEFNFLGYTLRVVSQPRANRPGVVTTTGQLLPESWFVDLSEDVEPDPDLGALVSACQQLGNLVLVHIGD